MPGSVRENDAFVRQFVIDNRIQVVLDVGAGQGTYSDILRPLVLEIDAIEIWEPYVFEFDLHAKYDYVVEADARVELDILAGHPEYRFDLVIFGDVLEHMTEDESVKLWSDASKISKWGMLSVPIIHYPQGPEFGNPYEVHVQEHLHPEKVRSLFGPFDLEEIYPITGTFIKEFTNAFK